MRVTDSGEYVGATAKIVPSGDDGFTVGCSFEILEPRDHISINFAYNVEELVNPDIGGKIEDLDQGLRTHQDFKAVQEGRADLIVGLPPLALGAFVLAAIALVGSALLSLFGGSDNGGAIPPAGPQAVATTTSTLPVTELDSFDDGFDWVARSNEPVNDEGFGIVATALSERLESLQESRNVTLELVGITAVVTDPDCISGQTTAGRSELALSSPGAIQFSGSFCTELGRQLGAEVSRYVGSFYGQPAVVDRIEVSPGRELSVRLTARIREVQDAEPQTWPTIARDSGPGDPPTAPPTTGGSTTTSTALDADG